MEGKMRNRLHSCEECQDVYNVSEKEIVVHMLLAHESAYCWSCETLFESRDEKVLHDDFSHFVLRCSKCSEVLKDEVQLALHAEQAHKAVICGYCSVWIEADKYPEHSAIIHKINHPASSPKSHISSKSHNPNPSQSLPLSHKRKNIVTLENLAENIITKNIDEPNANRKHTIQYICNLCNSFHKNFSHLLNDHQFSPKFVFELWTGHFKLESVTAVVIENEQRKSAKSKKFQDGANQDGAGQDSISQDDVIQDGARVEVLLNAQYTCPICNKSFQDAGLHLLFKHGMRRCPGESCSMYLEAGAAVCHDIAPLSCTTTSCTQPISSLYSLVIHVSEAHQIQTCYFCRNVGLKSVDLYINHLRRRHAVKNSDLLTSTSSPPVLNLVNSNLATYYKTKSLFECKLCDLSTKDRLIDCSKDFNPILYHLKVFHRIQTPERLYASIFDGHQFAYKNMALSEDEICHDPLVNFNPIKRKNSLPNPETDRHLCIICGKQFISSDLVQVHLIAEHISLGVSTNPTPPASRHQGHLLAQAVDEIIDIDCLIEEEKLRKANKRKSSDLEIVTGPKSQESMNQSECRVKKSPDRSDQSECKTFENSSQLESETVNNSDNSNQSDLRAGPTKGKKKETSAGKRRKKVTSRALKDTHSTEICESDNINVEPPATISPSVHIPGNYDIDNPDDGQEGPNDDPDGTNDCHDGPNDPGESELEIDEEHFSINNVEVSIKSDSNALQEQDYCPSIDKRMMIDQLNEEGEEGGTEVRVIGLVGKNPVFLRCEICGVVLTSILGFSSHMRKEHKDCDLEKNKPFPCNLCTQSFYFKSSLNSHRSKAHHEISGVKYTCTLCPSVTNSKNGMRRHMKNCHGTIAEDYLNFSCEFCTESFPSILEKKSHISRTHKESVNVEQCFLCTHISPNKTALRRHFQRIHPGEPLFETVSYKCGQCDLLFPLKSLLSSHIKEIHPRAVLYQCVYCLSQFTSKNTLATHVALHKQEYNGEELSCTKCDKVFKSPRALKNHVVSVHNELKSKPRQNKKISCRICKIRFASSEEKTVHMSEKHKYERPYSCTECGITFSSRSGLYNHRGVHKNSGLFTCSFCEKVFSRRDTFKEHALIHSGPRHKCPHCPKDFVQRSNLKRHIRIHLGIKPYKCALCESSFSDKGACNSHMKTHTGEERDSCSICGMGFSKKQKLKYHMRTHTGEGLKSCIICDKVFTHSYALNSHVRIHQKENQFMCYVCKKNGIKTKEDLYSHLGEHGSGDFQCTECDAVFRFSKLLNRHVLTVHKQLKGFQCSAQTCNYRTAYIQHIREHTQESHSVKNPQCPTHFLDHHNSTWILEDDKCNVLEEDLYSIYECLDPILDQHVLGSEYKEEEAFTNVKEEREDADERDGEGFTDENESENAGNNLEDGGIEHEDDTKEQEEGEDELEREDDQEVVELEGFPVKQEYIE